MPDRDDTTIISCGIFSKELERLKAGPLRGLKILLLDSMLHMQPAHLDDVVGEVLDNHPGRRTLLVYGDCGPNLVRRSSAPGVRRVEGMNCCEILLGEERYRALRKEGVFFLMPEWTLRWEEVFKNQLGLTDAATARDFMHEMHSRLIYLDTGLVTIPEKHLTAIADHFTMPVEIKRVGLDHLLKAIVDGMECLRDA